jgi:hypothetical protein
MSKRNIFLRCKDGCIFVNLEPHYQNDDQKYYDHFYIYLERIDKIQHPCVIKSPKKLTILVYLNTIKVIYDKLTANILSGQ